MKQPPQAFTTAPAPWAASKPPLPRFLDRCHVDFSAETGGAVADYIPELGKADPAPFRHQSRHPRRPRLRGRRYPPALHGPVDVQAIRICAGDRYAWGRKGERRDRRRTIRRPLQFGAPATSLFFLRSGAVHVTLPDGARLATLTAGMAFGEMALLETHRSADVLADMAASAYEIRLQDFERFRKQHPKASERIMRNLMQLLADRLIVANTRVDFLTAH